MQINFIRLGIFFRVRFRVATCLYRHTATTTVLMLVVVQCTIGTVKRNFASCCEILLYSDRFVRNVRVRVKNEIEIGKNVQNAARSTELDNKFVQDKTINFVFIYFDISLYFRVFSFFLTFVSSFFLFFYFVFIVQNFQ